MSKKRILSVSVPLPPGLESLSQPDVEAWIRAEVEREFITKWNAICDRVAFYGDDPDAPKPKGIL